MVLLVTYSLKHLSSAHSIIVLEEGRIQYNGNLTDIQRQGFDFTIRLAQAKDDEYIEREVQPDRQDKDEMAAEEAPIAHSSGGFTPYAFFARAAGWSNTSRCIVLMILVGLTRLGLPIYLKEWSTSDGTRYASWIGGYAGFAFASLM